MRDEEIELDSSPDQTSRTLKRVRTNACGSDSLFFKGVSDEKISDR